MEMTSLEWSFDQALAQEISRLAESAAACEGHVSMALGDQSGASLRPDVIEGLQELDHLVQVLGALDGIMQRRGDSKAAKGDADRAAVEACSLSSLRARLLGAEAVGAQSGAAEFF